MGRLRSALDLRRPHHLNALIVARNVRGSADDALHRGSLRLHGRRCIYWVGVKFFRQNTRALGNSALVGSKLVVPVVKGQYWTLKFGQIVRICGLMEVRTDFCSLGRQIAWQP